MRLRTRKGFSVVELMIVIAIVGVMGAIAAMTWNKYVANANLRTAARDLMSDMQYCKAKAVSESKDFLIVYSTGSFSGAWTTDYPITKVIKYRAIYDYGSGIKISSVSFGSPYSNAPLFQARGTSSPGTMIMTNDNGSKATITTNITGKVYVTYAMQ